MIEKLLAQCLQPVLDAEAQLRRRRVLITTLTLGAAGFLVLFALAHWRDWWSWQAVFGWLAFLTVAGVVALVRAGRSPDLRELARKVEDNHPDLQAALLAAMDQKPSADGELSYLQKRLLADVSEHAVRNQWVRNVSSRRLFAAGWGQFAALVGFCLSVWILLGVAPGNRPLTSGDPVAEQTPGEPEPADIIINVSPGDVELEKGSRLVVEASFPNRAPANAMLVVTNADGEKKVPMTVGLDDSVFSALLPKVDLAGSYRVTYEQDSSGDFSISVFEFPALLQSDAVVTPPAFLNEEPREIADTRKITVMEGSTVEWRLRVNKPIVMAELFGEDEVSIPLKPDPADPTLLLATHTPAETQRYRVHLVDDADRANKRPPWITVNVKRNEPPELKLTFPGRDFEVTAVQELPLEAEVWDDVAIEKAGFAYQYGEKEVSTTLTEESLAGQKKHPLQTQLDLEELGAEPKDLITYYFWAEDRDNDGSLRRTTSDMFFAEVRFFEEIIREGQPQSGQGGPQGDSDELLKLQKDVINAAWKLRRYHELGREFETLVADLEVVQQSQVVVSDRAVQVIEKAEDAELKQIFTGAKALMDKAAEEFALVLTERDGDLIAPAHQTARAVFAKLIEARSRESQISMQKNPSQGSSQQRQQTNMNLELEQKELKYEEQSKAQQEQQTAEQKENLAILSRLKELAKRQEAIAKKIKELEEQLQNASEQEKAEIERQLKRLQEEQRELLRETDDLSERMDSEENRGRMSEERDQLEKTRENIQEAAENLESGELADAANSATRAQRELEEMEEEFRERTSQQFAEEMRGLRDAARQLAEDQQKIGEKLEELTNSDSTDPFESDDQQNRAEVAQAISNQSRALSDLIEEMKQLSEEAEPSEPILSDSLYETVRNTMMNGVEEALEEARDYTFYNRPNQALQPEQAAARGIEELKESVEAAAEKVLGSEADALRLARSELDRLIEETREESERLAGGGNPEEETGTDGETDPSTQASAGQEAQEGAEAPQQASTGKGSPGAEKGEEPGPAQSGQPGEKGKAPGKGKGEGEESLAAGEQPGRKGEGKGKAPGKGEGTGDESLAAEEQPGRKGQGKGKAPGKGEGTGKAPGKGEGTGDESLAAGEQPGRKGEGKGKAPGKGEGTGDESGSEGQQIASNQNGGRRSAISTGGDDRGGGLPTGGQVGSQPLFFNRQSEQRREGPITGENYEDFRDRLGNIEEMLPQNELRDAARRVADNARSMRIDFSRDNLPPGAGDIETRITEPLIELRQRISEEIAKLNKENPLVPIDRDPVPSEFRDLVRRYYEELGAGD